MGSSIICFSIEMSIAGNELHLYVQITLPAVHIPNCMANSCIMYGNVSHMFHIVTMLEQIAFIITLILL